MFGSDNPPTFLKNTNSTRNSAANQMLAQILTDNMDQLEREDFEDRIRYRHYIFPKCCIHKQRHSLLNVIMLVFSWEFWFVCLTIFEYVLLYLDIAEVLKYFKIIEDKS